MQEAIMLVALMNGVRIEAADAERGPDYECPNCHRILILRKGSIVIHHFAHKPPVNCSWASEETKAHLAAKKTLLEAFRARGLRAEVEVQVLSTAGDRRADVLVWSPDEKSRVAIEVQHQPILFEAIHNRTRAYMSAGIPVIWMGLLSEKVFNDAQILKGGYLISQYVARPWERWAHAYGYKELWFMRVEDGTMWRGVLSAHLIDVPLSTWYGEGGQEESAGGYTRVSRRWRELRLTGPYDPRDILIKPGRRKPWSGDNFSIPGGVSAQFLAP
jgi:competence protein CoiA